MNLLKFIIFSYIINIWIYWSLEEKTLHPWKKENLQKENLQKENLQKENL